MALPEIVAIVLASALGAASRPLGRLWTVVGLAVLGISLFAALLGPWVGHSSDLSRTVRSAVIYWAIAFVTFIVVPFALGRLGYWLVEKVERRAGKGENSI